MIRLPEPSTTVPHALDRSARVARPASPSGPKLLVPAGVVSVPAWFTCRTVVLAAAYTEPPANDTPQGEKDTLVAGAGPGPLPPATVEMPPAARAWTPARAAAAGNSAVTVAAAATTATRPAGAARQRFLALSVLMVMTPFQPFCGADMSTRQRGTLAARSECRVKGPVMSGERGGAARRGVTASRGAGWPSAAAAPARQG